MVSDFQMGYIAPLGPKLRADPKNALAIFAPEPD
jgi:hypothetical protein